MRTTLLSILLLVTLPVAACGGKGHTVTTTTETIECEEPDPYADPSASDEERCTEVRRETTVVTHTEPGCDGVVSCTFGLVGGLVSLPFRIVGEVLDTVF